MTHLEHLEPNIDKTYNFKLKFLLFNKHVHYKLL